MAIVGNLENSERWFDPDFPTTKEIRSNLAMKDSGNLSYRELVQAVEELKQSEGLRITRSILPEVLETRIYQGMYRKENPNAYNVWRYGDRIRIRDFKGNIRWSRAKANEEGFNLHIHTPLTLKKITDRSQKDKIWTGFHITTPDYRSLYHPLIFAVRGRSYAWFLKSHPERAQEKFQGLKYDLKDYGDRSLMRIPSRTERKLPGRDYTDYTLHGVRIIGLPVDEETKFVSPVRIDILCDCEWSVFNQGIHKRWMKPEQLFCTHAVAAIELDKPYREEISAKVRDAIITYLKLEKQIKSAKEEDKEALTIKKENLEAFIEANSGSIPLLNDLTYKPGKNLVYFNDVLDRKVTIKDQGAERTLNEIEREILLNQKMFIEVGKENYTRTLNSDSGDYLVNFLNDPYNFSYNTLQELNSKSLQDKINALYGPE